MVEAIQELAAHGGRWILGGVVFAVCAYLLWDCFTVWNSPQFREDCRRLKAQRAARLAARDDGRRYPLEPWEVVLFIVALMAATVMFWPVRP